MITDRIERNTTYHPTVTEGDELAHAEVRETIRRTMRTLDAVLPADCGEKSAALMKLEEAMFWANAALARSRGDREAAA